MKTSEMKEHVHPEVVERLQAQFDKPLLLVTTMNNMVEGQHFEAAAQVGKQLSEQMEQFRQQLETLRNDAQAHQDAKAKPAAKPAEAKPQPAPATTASGPQPA